MRGNRQHFSTFKQTGLGQKLSKQSRELASLINIPPGRVFDMLDVGLDVKLVELSREGPTQQENEADFQATCSSSASTAIFHIKDMRSLAEKGFQKPKKYQPEIDPSPDLCIKGVAIRASGACQKLPLQQKINDVLLDVGHLVERLEADRQRTEEALQKEKRTQKTLQSKIDSTSLWKLKEHSSIVQKEHEACTRHIADLKRHLKLENWKVDQVQEKLLQAKLLNRNLQEDVEFARNQIPTVKENLNQQGEILHQIETAQAEADDVYRKTTSQLLQAREELKEMEDEAKKEKMSLDHQRMKIQYQLSEKTQYFNELSLLEKSLLGEIKDTEEAISHTEDKCADIMQRIPEIAESEKIEKDKILQLNLEIENEEQKNRKLKEKQTSRQEEIDRKKTEVSFTEAQLQSKREAFAALRRENQECEQKVEDYKMRICKSEKALRDMREERRQMLQKITENDEQWERAKEEEAQVVAQHSVIRAKLEEQEQLTFMEEQTARAQIENFRKDLTANMTALEVLKAQSLNVNDELKKQRESFELTNRQLRKEFDGSSSATQALDDKVKKMKELIEKSETIQCEHERLLINLKKDKELKLDQLKASQDLHSAISQRIDNTLARHTLLINESEEYKKSSYEMEKIVEPIPDAITNLEKKYFRVVDYKNKSTASFNNIVQSDVDACLQRTERFVKIHTAHLQTRKELMEEKKKALDAALVENKQLASKYEDLQKTLLEAKWNSVHALDEKNCQHERYAYYLELSLLQKRMHRVLVKSLEQRNLLAQAALDKCQAASQHTAWEIEVTQKMLFDEIEQISSFLQSLGDVPTATEDQQTSQGATGRLE